jgi:hypothetical protein
MDMRQPLLPALFGCLHRNTTFPLTPIRRVRNASSPVTVTKAQTYIACLDCGRELPYDWDKMQRVKTTCIDRSVLAFRRLATQLRLTSAKIPRYGLFVSQGHQRISPSRPARREESGSQCDAA